MHCPHQVCAMETTRRCVDVTADGQRVEAIIWEGDGFNKKKNYWDICFFVRNLGNAETTWEGKPLTVLAYDKLIIEPVISAKVTIAISKISQSLFFNLFFISTCALE